MLIKSFSRTGDVDIMKKLCEREIEQKTKRTTPLFVAAQNNQKKMVEHLLKKCKKDERTSNMEGVTPLLIAVREGNAEIVKMLLDKESVEDKDNADRNVFHYAFMSREPEKLTKMIKDFIEDKNFSESPAKFSEKMMDLLTAKDLNEDTPFHKLSFTHDAGRPPLVDHDDDDQAFEKDYGVPRRLLFKAAEPRPRKLSDWWSVCS